MEYREVLNFNPINEVVKFDKLESDDYRINLVRNFVFTKAYTETIIPLMCQNLDFTGDCASMMGNTSAEYFGMQVVGSYGTGKSHLMSLISLVASDAKYLDYIEECDAKKYLEKIAGKYKVYQFELGNFQELWDIVCYKIDSYLESIGVEYSISADDSLDTYSQKILKMMAHFEEKYPNQGFLLVIDEMLSYLKGRSEPSKLNKDLAVLQALGQAADSSKFRIMFGVQELIYTASEFQFAGEMLQKVNARYRQYIITKEDVKYIVRLRLLKKDEHQKQAIRRYLEPFTSYFSDMHAHFEDYVELFPIHPSYFDNFQQIKIGKSQREILKTLSHKCETLMDKTVPADVPGLVCYDDYWHSIANSADLMAIPDIRRVKDVMETIEDKIDSNFTGARARRKPLAHRIASACAIKVLQQDLGKQNGTTAEAMVDDLCYKDAISSDREELIDFVNLVSKDIVWATSGSFFDNNTTTNEYYIRIEGGVNYEQRISDYAEQMSLAQKDEFFYTFLSEILVLSEQTYRSGFRIWSRSIEWVTHKTMRDGYIFMGNPNEKDTTSPRQHFYIYFLPIFNVDQQTASIAPDELFFEMYDLSDNIKQKISLYGAALALEKSADNTQKTHYKLLRERYYKELKSLFETEFIEKTQVEYCGERCPMKSYPLTGALSKDMMIDAIASQVFENHFEEENPQYPKFTNLQESISKDNFDRFVKSAKQKIVSPLESNRNGEAILSGLGLYKNGHLSVDSSIYARNIIQKIEEHGDKVINQKEILEVFWKDTDTYLSVDYKIESEYEFLVLATMATMGYIEIVLSDGRSVVNAANIATINNLDKTEYYSFSHIRKPKGINYAVVREISMKLVGRDLSTVLDRLDTYEILSNKAQSLSSRAVKIANQVNDGYLFQGEFEIITKDEGYHIGVQLTGLSRMCDKLRSYNSEAKMKNLPWSLEEVQGILSGIDVLEGTEALIQQLSKFKIEVDYLQQAKQYVTDADLRNSIDGALSKFAKVIQQRDSHKEESLLKELEQVHLKYAEWYLEQYLKYHINELTNKDKEKLMNDDKRLVCDMIKNAEYLNSMRYDNWIKQMGRLQLASSAVTKEAILQRPYHNFNPKEYQGEPWKTIGELKEELYTIYDDYDKCFRAMMKDPGVKKNRDGLTKEEQKLMDQFIAGTISLDNTYALKLRALLDKLHKGFDRIAIDSNQILEVFSQPMTPEEAIEAFTKYIEEQLKGKDRKMARIIVK